MSDPLIIQTLKQKRAEISGVIAAYQAKIALARHDLAHINAVIRLVEGGEQERAQYIVSHGFFKKGRSPTFACAPAALHQASTRLAPQMAAGKRARVKAFPSFNIKNARTSNSVGLT